MSHSVDSDAERQGLQPSGAHNQPDIPTVTTVGIVALAKTNPLRSMIQVRTAQVKGETMAKERTREYDLHIGLPMNLFSVKWKYIPTQLEQEAAWDLYVELVTRVATNELGAEQGLLREALSSLHTVFEITRGILKEHGPRIYSNKRPGFSHLAIRLLNYELRPFLSKWHPALGHHEASRPVTTSPLEWERQWESEQELREDLRKLQDHIFNYYAKALSRLCEVEALDAHRL